ncbi:MAG: serine hydrolase [Bacteroidales bacterium]|jgi:D-alanyl-D-alanine carboxypeptidase|nr:serine hydrolase [Bacteroidales bacterium]
MKEIAFIFLFYSSIISLFAQSETINKKGLTEFHSDLVAMITDNEPGAEVIITHSNEIIFEEYYGLANVNTGEKLNAEHVMGIASMSKQFTGMAILFLVDEEKLRLKDDISDYFPDLPLQGRKINIKQLLSHISGLPELTQNNEFMDAINHPHTIEQIIEMAFKGEFRSETGEKFLYCNTGYTIATALIEKLSGMKYAEFLKERIFDPLKMENTYACDFENDAISAVQRHTTDSISYQKAIEMHFSNLIGGGGIISNASDMAKWGMALLSGEKLPKNYQKLWEPILLNSGESIEYGLGMGISDFEGKRFYYHPGMGSGMNSINLIFPNYDLTITVIRNISKPKHSSLEIALLAAKYFN